MKTPPERLVTAEEVRQDFARRGVSVRSWALAAGVDPATAAHVVAGRSKGRIGEAHRVAVLLGLKHGIAEPRRAPPPAAPKAAQRVARAR